MNEFISSLLYVCMYLIFVLLSKSLFRCEGYEWPDVWVRYPGPRGRPGQGGPPGGLRPHLHQPPSTPGSKDFQTRRTTECPINSFHYFCELNGQDI